MNDVYEVRHRNAEYFVPRMYDSHFVFGVLWALLLLGTFIVAAPWAGFHGILLGCAGLLIMLRPPVVALPRAWWLLAAVFALAGTAAFLPADWFGVPEWRRQLAALGVPTGPLVVIQARQAAEALALFVITLFIGLWLAGHRPTPTQIRLWAMAFTIGVAAYAIAARVMQHSPHSGYLAAENHYGFFPNRNHTATYLAMGAICGLGNVLQAIRDKRMLAMAIALGATGVCLWAVAVWSLSRGGIVLVAGGGLVWLSMLGPSYLGKNGIRALGLMALAVIGLFLIVDTGVKGRLSATVEKANTLMTPADRAATMVDSKPACESNQDFDFRIPTALDTFDLIRDFKWTGIGAGQYYYVFPQYRQRIAVLNDNDNYHPESDWLWLAAELGIPAALALVVLVVLAFSKSIKAILPGRDRALRSACLVAALTVPIHGIFDVPGHRITLALSAALLFTLSLHAPAADAITPSPKSWPFRLAALVLIAIAAWLCNAQWWGGPQPALTAAPNALYEAKCLYRKDRALQQTALAQGKSYQPAPADDRLEQALAILEQAAPLAPLDRDLLRYQSFLALCYDNKYALLDRTFAIERALDPTWVDCPLRQSEALVQLDAQRTLALWDEALRRADQFDRRHPASLSARKQVIQRIRQLAKGKPQLEAWLTIVK